VPIYFAGANSVAFQIAGLLHPRLRTARLAGELHAVFRERGSAIPALMREIGRAREVTFRAAGEGTGKEIDLDVFDARYTHLILWHKPSGRVAGAYRLAWTQDILPTGGVRGLYTSTLFRFDPAFSGAWASR
jgi:hypothetical protein